MVSLEHLAIGLAVAVIPPSIAQLVRAVMFRSALRGSKPSERAAILGGLAKIQPFTPSPLRNHPSRKARGSRRNGEALRDSGVNLDVVTRL
jgi:hypothetical protein